MNALGTRQLVPGLWVWTAGCAHCTFYVESNQRAAAEWRLFHHDCEVAA